MTINRRHFLQGAAALPAAAAIVPATANLANAAAPLVGQQVPGIYRFTVGDAEVTALLDGHLDFGTELINDLDEAKAAEAMAKNMQPMMNGSLRIPVNGYLVNSGGRLTLIDAGTAQLMGPTLGKLESGLAAVGVQPSDIDTVLLTHIHPDHSGGLVNGEGKAVFENAELAVSKTEWDFWYDDSILAGVPDGNKPFFHMARNTTSPYRNRLKLIEGEGEVAAGFTPLALPGHTPGHTGYMLNSGDESLLFWGDVIHMTGLQFTHPDMTIVYDMDPVQTAQTRRNLMDRAAADNLLVTGAHIDFPGLGRVHRDGDAYRYQAAPWQYAL
ncbi:MBL fold metallo-hydrolase [Parasedimentitalea maritima]|uniref:MBL fold metallo-hydrolase n=1 Tax=Parasedimentitalea maritima TaxID=2578117 RepID=A0A6A4RI19_9RHOB|nr:MBL fold metallo-hydrolase [Zongyanglinia marina]KAE9628636.1 MBL fold metallo-hydrolase [Zongyanglinia marina]